MNNGASTEKRPRSEESRRAERMHGSMRRTSGQQSMPARKTQIWMWKEALRVQLGSSGRQPVCRSCLKSVRLQSIPQSCMRLLPAACSLQV